MSKYGTLVATIALVICTRNSLAAQDAISLQDYTCEQFSSDINRPSSGEKVLRSLMVISWANGYAAAHAKAAVRADAVAMQVTASNLGMLCSRQPKLFVVQAFANAIEQIIASGHRSGDAVASGGRGAGRTQPTMPKPLGSATLASAIWSAEPFWYVAGFVALALFLIVIQRLKAKLDKGADVKSKVAAKADNRSARSGEAPASRPSTITLRAIWVQFFSFKGRINRTNYLVGTVLNIVIVAGYLSVIYAINKLVGGLRESAQSTTLILFILICVTCLTSLFAFFVRRLHDCNLAGTWALLLFAVACLLLASATLIRGDSTVPWILLFLIVGAVAGITLVPGSNGKNRFGAKPIAGIAWRPAVQAQGGVSGGTPGGAPGPAARHIAARIVDAVIRRHRLQ